MSPFPLFLSDPFPETPAPPPDDPSCKVIILVLDPGQRPYFSQNPIPIEPLTVITVHEGSALKLTLIVSENIVIYTHDHYFEFLVSSEPV